MKVSEFPLVVLFCVLAALSSRGAAERADSGKFISETFKMAQACKKEGHDYPTCLLDVVPDRCRQAALHLLADAPAGHREFVMCMRTCANAGWWTRHMGECARG